MVVPTTTFGTAPILYKLNYNPMKAFDPVGLIGVDKLILVAGPESVCPERRFDGAAPQKTVLYDERGGRIVDHWERWRRSTSSGSGYSR